MDFKEFYSGKLAKFETYLKESFPALPQEVESLDQSMRYSLFAGGKRIRPIFLLTTVESCGEEDSDFALPFASALEYIHTYSLIHDDLPCMDDDDLRRGVPTNHKKFGEDIALLAGDALLTHSFNLMSAPALSPKVPAEKIVRIINLLSAKCGIFGMVSGQVADIKNDDSLTPEESLLFIHKNKTGALITASIQIGAILGNAGYQEFKALTTFGEEIGKCFQIQDDILDETGTPEELGKTPGSDVRNDTLTYPKVYGLEKSKQLATESYEKALNSLAQTGLDTTRLRELAEFILKRSS